MSILKIILVIIILLIFIEFILFNIIRICKRYFYYKHALRYSKSVKKPLLVIGDPDGGWYNRHFGRTYGCGDLCTDLNDCSKCEYSEKGDILDVLKTKNDNSYVIFESCVLECILDVKKIQQIKSEINRVSVKSFHVRIQPSILMLSNTMTKSLERYTFN